jgi:hypothetical protein
MIFWPGRLIILRYGRPGVFRRFDTASRAIRARWFHPGSRRRHDAALAQIANVATFR